VDIFYRLLPNASEDTGTIDFHFDHVRLICGKPTCTFIT